MANELVKQDEFDLGIDFSDMMMIVMMVVMVSILQSVSTLAAQVQSAEAG